MLRSWRQYSEVRDGFVLGGLIWPNIPADFNTRWNARNLYIRCFLKSFTSSDTVPYLKGMHTGVRNGTAGPIRARQCGVAAVAVSGAARGTFERLIHRLALGCAAAPASRVAPCCKSRWLEAAGTVQRALGRRGALRTSIFAAALLPCVGDVAAPGGRAAAVRRGHH